MNFQMVQHGTARPRASTTIVRRGLREQPAAALGGARQCDKTTLARRLGGVYFDLEQPQERPRLDLEWEPIVRGGAVVVLDKAQSAPEAFVRLRSAIDAEPAGAGKRLPVWQTSRVVEDGRTFPCNLPWLLGHLHRHRRVWAARLLHRNTFAGHNLVPCQLPFLPSTAARKR